MDLHSAIQYWLQIRLVSEARTTDEAAKKTYDFFQEIVSQDFGVSNLVVDPYGQEDETIRVRFVVKDKQETLTFDREMIEKLLQDIEANPKYQ
jgi:hypothetical protein